LPPPRGSAAASPRAEHGRAIRRRGVAWAAAAPTCAGIIDVAKRENKLRADFRKNRAERTRPRDLIRRLQQGDEEAEDLPLVERVSGKGELTRRRTVRGQPLPAEGDDQGLLLEVDESRCLRGRVLAVHGLTSVVEAEGGRQFKCATRRLLKTLATDQRHVVACGDWVWFRPVIGDEGVIERIEPRHGVLNRAVKGRQHVVVANVDQILVVGSAAQPELKPHLIDRFLACAEHNRLAAVVCINKIDLVDPAGLQPLVGVYSQLGYRVLLTSATEGIGIERLRRVLEGKATVVAGQSGVGKSRLLNAVEPGFQLKVGSISRETEKGRHTTTTARLLPLSGGGYVADTPGIRQFALWDVIPAELPGLFREMRPLVCFCTFPDCTHAHEAGCAVKDAVADGRLDVRRYESYLALLAGDDA